MYLFAPLVSLALLLAPAVHAAVYVTNPVQASQCAGGQSCQVQWVDDGTAPLLASIGQCQVGLYSGNFQLVQSLPSVDVSQTSSFTFTPDPAAGPNGPYYIVFTATSVNYQGFSGSFTLTGMSGTTPGGGSSTPASTSATGTSSGSSLSAGSTTPATTSSGTATTPSGTSTSVTGTSSAPTSSPSVVTSTTPTPTTTPTSASFTTPTTTTSRATSTSASGSTSASASAITSGAGRVGSSVSLGGLAALLALSGVLAF